MPVIRHIRNFQRAIAGRPGIPAMANHWFSIAIAIEN